MPCDKHTEKIDWRCNQCRYRAHPEGFKRRALAWRAAHPAKYRAQAAVRTLAFYHRNRDEINARRRARYAARKAS